MLSDEEKESAKEYQEVSEKILNLIKKQSKEIEELKEKNKITKQMNENLIEVLKGSISIDKIKAKIEEVKDGTFDAKIVLQSLLEKE